MDLSKYERIDWDDPDDTDDPDLNNLLHCLQHGVTEQVVIDVLAGEPREIKLPTETAEFVVCGPDRGGQFWTLLFVESFNRGDWLRPVTGWRSGAKERMQWERGRGSR